MMIEELKPCPFCGEKPKWWSCDRLITIGCDTCGYSRHFAGLINGEPNDTPVHYTGGKISTTEFYHHDAREKAIKEWNRRADNENDD